MKFIELTDEYGTSVFINMSHVIAVEVYRHAPCQSLVVTGSWCKAVKETPDEIFERLRSLTREC